MSERDAVAWNETEVADLTAQVEALKASMSQGHHRPGQRDRIAGHLPAGRRPRAGRRRAGTGQDAAGQVAGAGHRHAVPPRAVHARPDAVRYRRHRDPRRRHQPRASACSASRRALCSRRCCWPTRSTARRPRPSPRCSKRCRNARSPSPATPTGCRSRSSCWRPRTRSSRPAPIRCRKRSSTASCCASTSATRPKTKK